MWNQNFFFVDLNLIWSCTWVAAYLNLLGTCGLDAQTSECSVLRIHTSATCLVCGIHDCHSDLLCQHVYCVVFFEGSTIWCTSRIGRYVIVRAARNVFHRMSSLFSFFSCWGGTSFYCKMPPERVLLFLYYSAIDGQRCFLSWCAWFSCSPRLVLSLLKVFPIDASELCIVDSLSMCWCWLNNRDMFQHSNWDTWPFFLQGCMF